MLESAKYRTTMTLIHPWNDLEQRFLRFTTTAKELAESISVAVDDGRVPADIVDSVSNIAIGLKQYVATCEDEIASAMEDRIGHDYKTGALQQTRGVLEIADDYTIQLPDLLRWVPGDTLEWEVTGDGTAVVRKLGK